jgi:D-3-phosphoglycerate dehydrogenase
MKAGKWEKKKFGGREVTGKTLGIVGIGRIGSIVADRAKGLHMQIIAFDPYMPKDIADKLGIKLVSLDDLCKRSDYITVHVPLIKETARILSSGQFKLMKNDAMLIDCARGGVVDEEALYEALKAGEIAGAALDVFAVEPTNLENNPLLGLDNFICTPHLGASTSEAQVNVAVAIAEQMADYLNNGTITNAVNVPSVSAEVMTQVGPFINLAATLGTFHMQIANGGVKAVDIEYVGELADLDVKPVTVAFLKGLFTPILKEAVNFINAPMIAKDRGIKVTESRTNESGDFTNLLKVTVRTTEGENVLVGTVFGRSEPRLVRLNSFRLESLPAGPMLYVYNNDVPGVIGILGSTLADFGVNIQNMTVGREADGKQNVILLNTDQLLDKKQLAAVVALDNINAAMVLDMPEI